MWLKYSRAPILLDEYRDRNQTTDFPSSFSKPCGTWITDDSGQCWREWCLAEGFRLDDLTHKHEVVLDESNILVLRNSRDLVRFDQEYGGEPSNPNLTYRHVAWERVAARYDGLIITPHQVEQHFNLMWYNGWDCASGCIWRASAIREIKLLEIDLLVTKGREEAA